MGLIEAKGITKRYANHTALNNVSIDVPEGSIYGLLGPNGAGKTSLIRIINMITAPDEGEIFLGGEKLKASHIEKIGYLPEERGLYKKMSVGEQSVYLAQLKGMTKIDAQKKLKIWFEKFEIMPWWNRKVEELSKGMQQKVQFIVTVLHEPKLLIFDEPFSGFDPINANLIKEEILKLKEHGSTIIFSTHNMASVEELCDYIALINKSKKILEGKVSDIKNTYKNNAFRVELANVTSDPTSFLTTKMQVLESRLHENYFEARLKIAADFPTNEMVKLLMQYGSIQSVNEIIPNMGDIFITKVKNDSGEVFANVAPREFTE